MFLVLAYTNVAHPNESTFGSDSYLTPDDTVKTRGPICHYQAVSLTAMSHPV